MTGQQHEVEPVGNLVNAIFDGDTGHDGSSWKRTLSGI
jgi:hypothetical protein